MTEGTGSQRYCTSCGAEAQGILVLRTRKPVNEDSEPPVQIRFPPTPSRSLADTLEENVSGLTKRFLPTPALRPRSFSLAGYPTRRATTKDLPSYRS